MIFLEALLQAALVIVTAWLWHDLFHTFDGWRLRRQAEKLVRADQKFVSKAYRQHLRAAAVSVA